MVETNLTRTRCKTVARQCATLERRKERRATVCKETTADERGALFVWNELFVVQWTGTLIRVAWLPGNGTNERAESTKRSAARNVEVTERKRSSYQHKKFEGDCDSKGDALNEEGGGRNKQDACVKRARPQTVVTSSRTSNVFWYRNDDDDGSRGADNEDEKEKYVDDFELLSLSSSVPEDEKQNDDYDDETDRWMNDGGQIASRATEMGGASGKTANSMMTEVEVAKVTTSIWKGWRSTRRRLKRAAVGEEENGDSGQNRFGNVVKQRFFRCLPRTESGLRSGQTSG